MLSTFYRRTHDTAIAYGGTVAALGVLWFTAWAYLGCPGWK